MEVGTWPASMLRFVFLLLQRGGMTAFAVAVRMTRACLAGQGSDGAGPLSAVFAGVFRSFVALIQGMSALADSIGVARARLTGQRLDARKSVSADLTIELCHCAFLSCEW